MFLTSVNAHLCVVVHYVLREYQSRGVCFKTTYWPYLKETSCNREDPPEYLQGLLGVRQEGQPAEGKGHHHNDHHLHHLKRR